MTYSAITRVEAPVEMYNAVHASVTEKTHGVIDGLLLHVGRATASGFEVLEVWTSKEHCDRFSQDVLVPLMAEMAAGRIASGQADRPPEPSVEEFLPAGLIVSAGERPVVV